MFEKYEQQGIMMRIDKKIWPTKMRSGSIIYEEMDVIRKVKNVIREGRVKAINDCFIQFENDVTISMDTKEALFIDCTSGSAKNLSMEYLGVHYQFLMVV